MHVKGKKRSITACSICCAVYILKDHYLCRDFNVSITLRRALGEGRGWHSLNRGGFHSAELCRLVFANAMSFPKLLQKKSQPTILVDGGRASVFSPLGKARSCWPVSKVFGMGWGDGDEGKT